MRHLRLFENFDESEYAELSYKMEKYMPEDPDITDEYYELLQDGHVEALKEFFENNADEEKMMQYMPDGGDLQGFVKYLIDSATM